MSIILGWYVFTEMWEEEMAVAIIFTGILLIGIAGTIHFDFWEKIMYIPENESVTEENVTFTFINKTNISDDVINESEEINVINVLDTDLEDDYNLDGI